MRELRHKKVLITGAAAGIGRSLALAFAREGADLFLLDVDDQGLAETVVEAKRCPVSVASRHCDVSRPEEISASVQAVLDHWGSLDVLVNNAGVCYYGPTTMMTDQQWQWLLSINLLAPIQFTQQLLPTLLSRYEAHVLNVSSFYGFFTTARATAYHVSKFGLIGFSEALRTEFGQQGLGVTALCPGYVRTNLYSRMACSAGRTAPPDPPRLFSTTPEVVARKAIRGVYRNQRMVLVTPLAYAAYYLKRFAPGLLDWASHLGRRRKLKKKRLKLSAAAALASGRQPAASGASISHDNGVPPRKAA
jgi:3-oxoacyl-[acyl-carrier protein] reductase